MALVETRRLTAFYGDFQALYGIDLRLEEGETLAIIGANGAGKSTFLKTIAGLLPATPESVIFAGRPIGGLPAPRIARLGISLVPEGRRLFPSLTVEENLRIGAYARRESGYWALEPIYDLFPALKQMLGRRGGDLSGGQQQQLAIGRALVLKPKLLILDEPTEGIQPNIVHEIGDILLKLNQQAGLTLLLVEQKLPFARRVASEFCILDKGRQVAAGAIANLTDQFVRTHLSV